MMEKHKVIMTNTAIIINDYDWGDCYTLERFFSIWDPIRHSYSYMGIYYDAETRKLYLPRGVDLFYVEKAVRDAYGYEDVIVQKAYPYKYSHTKDILMKYKPKDDRQLETLKFMVCKQEYEQNENKSQFSVNLNTGAGKTYCALATIAYLGIRSIVITSQQGILNQWKDRITEYCDINESELVLLKGSDMLNRIYHKKSTLMNKSIYFITHSTIQSYANKYGWESLGKIFETLGIGIKIIDEAHLDFNNVAMVDFFTNVWRTYYLTATPNRSDSNEDKIFKTYMKNIPSIELFDKDNDPHTNYISIKFNSNPRPSDMIICKHPIYKLNRLKYVDYLLKNDRFWIMFDYIFQLIYKNGGKALFYVATNNGIDKFRERIEYLYPELRDEIGVYTSLTDSSVKDNEKDKTYILSTTKSAGAGEDIKGLKYSVVLAEPFKSEVLAKQTLGRTRDPNTTYIDLVDIGFSSLVSYYNAKKHIFAKYALSCKNIDVDNCRIINLKDEFRMTHKNRFSEALKFNQPKMIEGIRFVKEKEMVEGIFFTDMFKI